MLYVLIVCSYKSHACLHACIQYYKARLPCYLQFSKYFMAVCTFCGRSQDVMRCCFLLLINSVRSHELRSCDLNMSNIGKSTNWSNLQKYQQQCDQKKLFKNLYKSSQTVQLPKSQAKKMWNQTWPIWWQQVIGKDFNKIIQINFLCTNPSEFLLLKLLPLTYHHHSHCLATTLILHPFHHTFCSLAVFYSPFFS